MTLSRRALIVVMAVLALLRSTAMAQTKAQTQDLRPWDEERANAYAGQLEAYLRHWLVEEYPDRTAKASRFAVPRKPF